VTTPRPAGPEPARERLQRTLARAGLGSRRSAEELIASGAVTVNGRVATLGDRVDPRSDEIRVRGARISTDPDLRYVALNKPRGVTTTMRDPHARSDLRAFLPSEGPRVFPVGRLDRDTEGLLLLTNDGDLANRLTHPRHGVEKEYLAEVDGVPSARRLALLRRGVDLEDGRARAVSVRAVGRTGGRAAVRIVMVEGRKREVRRMLDAVDLPVRRLIRVRIGPVRLGRLAPGTTRDLEPEEVRGLYRVAGL
jgi:23S rRNA pseudouridine2605 synthase